MRQMLDTVNAARLPVDASMVGAYTDGLYANEAAVRARCPHALVVTITPHGLAGANVGDCETGDLTPFSAAAWAAREVRSRRKPTIYCNLSTWSLVKTEVSKVGITGKVSYWIAHYDNIAKLIPGAVAKQYIERTDLNLDFSVAADYWPGVDPEPIPAPNLPEETSMRIIRTIPDGSRPLVILKDDGHVVEISNAKRQALIRYGVPESEGSPADYDIISK